MRGASSSMAEDFGDDGGDEVDDASSCFLSLSLLSFLPPLGSSASRTESRFFRPPSPRAWRMRRARMPSSAPFIGSKKKKRLALFFRLPSLFLFCFLPPAGPLQRFSCFFLLFLWQVGRRERI